MVRDGRFEEPPSKVEVINRNEGKLKCSYHFGGCSDGGPWHLVLKDEVRLGEASPEGLLENNISLEE